MSCTRAAGSSLAALALWELRGALGKRSIKGLIVMLVLFQVSESSTCGTLALLAPGALPRIVGASSLVCL